MTEKLDCLKKKEELVKGAIRTLRNDILQIEMSNKRLREFCSVMAERVNVIEREFNAIKDLLLR